MNSATSPRNAALPVLVALLLLSFATVGKAETAYQARKLLETTTDVLSQPIAYPGGTARITSEIITLKPGEAGKPHRHVTPMYAYILEGEIHVDYGDRGKRVFRKGDALVEAQQAVHQGVNKGSTPVHILVVYMGEEGTDDVAVAAQAP